MGDVSHTLRLRRAILERQRAIVAYARALPRGDEATLSALASRARSTDAELSAAMEERRGDPR